MATTYPQKVTTNFSVSFAIPNLSGILKAEVDTREADTTIPENKRGKNKKTSFIPGDPVYCLVFCGPYVKTVESIASLGTFPGTGIDGKKDGRAGTEELDQEETMTFQAPDGLSQTLSYPAPSVTEVSWVGTTMSWTYDPETNTITATSTKARDIAVAKVKYTSYGKSVLLTHTKPKDLEYEIAILLIGDYDPSAANNNP